MVAFALVALVLAFVLSHTLITRPAYTDAYYYFNAAERLVNGEGLTDTYLWTYIGAPDSVPTDGVSPSHLYWMPFSSLAAAAGMWLGGANFAAAQAPFILMLAGAAGVAFYLGAKLGGTRRAAWIAGLLVLLSPFYARYWGTTDGFAPFALFGSLALVFTGLTVERGRSRWALLAGVCAGVGHLTRADGLLLLLVAYVVVLWPWWKGAARLRLAALAALTVGYLLVMGPWFVRNLNVIGTPLPVGGAQGIWFTEYADVVAYPPGATPQTFFADGPGTLFETRWLAFTRSTLGTFIAVQGLIALAPLMLIGLWVKRRLDFVRAFWIYALGVHVVMTVVFPFPGMQGGLFHSAAGLMPWWMALGVVGLDAVVDWIARRRKRWNPRMAKVVFSGGLLLLAFALLWNLTDGLHTPPSGTPGLYQRLDAELPPDARVMINDPAALYYFTGRGGAVIPKAPIESLSELAERYHLTHLLVEDYRRPNGFEVTPPEFSFDVDNPPDFLERLPIEGGSIRVFAIRR